MTRRPATLPALVGAAALALALAGCGVTAPPVDVDTDTGTGTGTEAPDTSTAPATGELITGDGYSFQVPDGWGTPDQPTPGFDPDAFAADLGDADGFSDNVNVLLSPAGEITADQVEELGAPELENAGATDVAVQPRLNVAGAESAHITAKFSANGVPYWVEQYYPTNAGQTYIVTFSFSESVAEGDRVALAESVLASWTWL